MLTDDRGGLGKVKAAWQEAPKSGRRTLKILNLLLETLNLGWLAQPCFWHFVGQRALEHLLGWVEYLGDNGSSPTALGH